ncbi:unnamed protein product [Ambrosiozyma monospora]|uniref:Conserved oligomeric Golgi complex subunit 1 n=1 Tax=Ambrosiozyma monospora TaxID=43982 RepID=A0A9W6Z0N9_AMBMO|nr:unnamed protein product [Ambrosiozyma monospora]
MSNSVLMEMDISKVVEKTSEQLFETYPVQDLNQLKFRLFNEVNSKKSELRSLVGNKYRDLLKVADDIIEMNELTKVEDSKLAGLTFKKSNYASKSLPNFNRFQFDTLNQKVEKVKKTNRLTILRNLVHELDWTYLRFKKSLSDVGASNVDDDIDINDSIANEFIQLSKSIYLIGHHFADDIEKEEFTKWKFGSIKDSFLGDIKEQLITLLDDNEYEFALNLVTSYVIVTAKLPIEALYWYLNIRLEYFKTIDDFQARLRYIFNTLNYLQVLRTKVPTLLSRLIYSSLNSNWLLQTDFKNWMIWLDLPSDYTVSFPIKVIDLKIISKASLTSRLDKWKQQVGEFIYQKVTSDFNRTVQVSELSDSLNQLLVSYKSFTSLVDLQTNNGSLIDGILTSWKNKFAQLLHIYMNQFNDISTLVLKNVNDVKSLKPLKTNHGTNMFNFTDMTNIDAYTYQIVHPSAKAFGPIHDKMGDFKSNLNGVLFALISLKKLASTLTKPVLSIDDCEDPEFWKSTSKKIEKQVDNAIEHNIIEDLNGSVTKFFNKVSKMLEDEIQPIQNFYLIRILMQFEQRNLFELPAKDGLDFSNMKFISLNELIDPLLHKLFKPLVKQISLPYSEKLSDIIATRFEKDQEYAETSLWESDIENATKVIPNSSSLEVELLLFQLANQLINLGDDEGEDYSDVYIAPQFKDIKSELIKELSHVVLNGIPSKLVGQASNLSTEKPDVPTTIVTESTMSDSEPAAEVKKIESDDVVKSETAEVGQKLEEPQSTSMQQSSSVESTESTMSNGDETKPLTKSQKKKRKKQAAKARKAEAEAEAAAAAAAPSTVTASIADVNNNDKSDEKNTELKKGVAVSTTDDNHDDTSKNCSNEKTDEADKHKAEGSEGSKQQPSDGNQASTGENPSSSGKQPVLNEEKLKVVTLLTYADLIFLQSFFNNNDVANNDDLTEKACSKLVTLNSDLGEKNYRLAIQKSLSEHYKTNYLMFNPLSN